MDISVKYVHVSWSVLFYYKGEVWSPGVEAELRDILASFGVTSIAIQ